MYSAIWSGKLYKKLPLRLTDSQPLTMSPISVPSSHEVRSVRLW